jgi:hypothetical protein
MIVPMPTTARPQQRCDHRLRNLVQRTGDVTVATDLGILRSTARGWRGAVPTVVVGLDVADLTEPELRQEVLKLRRRVHKLAALLRLALALLRTSGFSLTGERLPDGRAKMADRWDAIVKQWKMIGDQPNPSSIAAAARRLSRRLLGLLESRLLARDPERHADILRTVMASETAYPVDGLVHLLRAAFTARCAEALFVERARLLRANTYRPVVAPRSWPRRLVNRHVVSVHVPSV